MRDIFKRFYSTKANYLHVGGKVYALQLCECWTYLKGKGWSLKQESPNTFVSLDPVLTNQIRRGGFYITPLCVAQYTQYCPPRSEVDHDHQPYFVDPLTKFTQKSLKKRQVQEERRKSNSLNIYRISCQNQTHPSDIAFFQSGLFKLDSISQFINPCH